ncbi:MAG TPA: response regulator [Phycisphaerae bacterium]|jgi:CheY-like chemotaxis protein
MEGKPPRVLNVGQCNLDHSNIQRTLSAAFGAQVERADTLDQAVTRTRAERFDLVLVNRILDVDGSTGLDVLRRLQEDDQTRDMPVMLVSNHADAQRAAVALGAAPGFGKNALDDPATVALLARYLNPQTTQISAEEKPDP